MKRSIILLCMYGTILCSCNTTRQVSLPKNDMYTQCIMTQNSTNSNHVGYVQCVTKSDDKYFDTIEAPKTEKKEGSKKFFRKAIPIIAAIAGALALGVLIYAGIQETK